MHFINLTYFLSFLLIPRETWYTFGTEPVASQSHCQAGPGAALALTGLGVVALATAVADRWGQAVSVD